MSTTDNLNFYLTLTLIKLCGNIDSLWLFTKETLEKPPSCRSEDFCVVAQTVLYYGHKKIVPILGPPCVSTFTSSLASYHFYSRDSTDFKFVFPIKCSDLPVESKILLCLYNIEPLAVVRCVAVHLFDVFTNRYDSSCDHLEQIDFGLFRLKLVNTAPLYQKKKELMRYCECQKPSWVIKRTDWMFEILSQFPKDALSQKQRFLHNDKHLLGDIAEDFSVANFLDDGVYLDVLLEKPDAQVFPSLVRALPDFNSDTQQFFQPSDVGTSSLENQYPNTVNQYNWEILWTNPTETKHSKLSKSRIRNDLANYDCKPNAEEQDALDRIAKRLSTIELSQEEKQLIWKFRATFLKKPSCLVKFAKSVDWSQQDHAEHALQLMKNSQPFGENQAIGVTDVGDVLEMLNWTNTALQKFVVTHYLGKLLDADIEIYLLQLVQSLRYDTTADCPLLALLIERSERNMVIANFLYWYLSSEEHGDNKNIFSRHKAEFLRKMRKTAKGAQMVHVFDLQQHIIDGISSIAKEVKRVSNRQEQFTLTNKRIHDYCLLGFEEPVPLPLDPNVVVRGIGPTVKIFSSANSPIHLDFHINHDKYYQVIFKEGDDLRQDQLVIQLIRLIDLLLTRENLTLNFIPYKILPTSRSSGFIEFVPGAHSIAEIERQRDKPTIIDFLRKYNPDPTTKTGISNRALDLYISSCAGYCVINHVFGWMDRHMNNILITESGNLFHIDFGWILGKYPSRLLRESGVRLTQNMLSPIEKSDQFNRFLTLVKEAFLLLRQHSSLLINVISLMQDSKLKDLNSKEDLYFIEKKLGLGMTEEEATNKLEIEIRLAPQSITDYVKETLHRWITKE